MKIGIIGAMDLEIRKLTTEEMTSSEIVEKAGMKFHVGRLGDTDVVIVKSGVGKVNAAVCAQILVNCFDVTHLINTGIAGEPRTASRASLQIPPCAPLPSAPSGKLFPESVSSRAGS